MSVLRKSLNRADVSTAIPRQNAISAFVIAGTYHISALEDIINDFQCSIAV